MGKYRNIACSDKAHHGNTHLTGLKNGLMGWRSSGCNNRDAASFAVLYGCLLPLAEAGSKDFFARGCGFGKIPHRYIHPASVFIKVPVQNIVGTPDNSRCKQKSIGKGCKWVGGYTAGWVFLPIHNKSQRSFHDYRTLFLPKLPVPVPGDGCVGQFFTGRHL